MRGLEQVIEEAKGALVCDPVSVRINQHLGNTFYNARRYDEAIRQYQQTLELDTRNASAHESLGEVYERHGRSQEAIEEWAKAADSNQDLERAAILRATDAKRSFASAVRAVAGKSLERHDRRTNGKYVTAI